MLLKATSADGYGLLFVCGFLIFRRRREQSAYTFFYRGGSVCVLMVDCFLVLSLLSSAAAGAEVVMKTF